MAGCMLDKVCISAAAKLVVLISEMGSWVNNDPVSLFVTMDSRPDELQMMKKSQTNDNNNRRLKIDPMKTANHFSTPLKEE